MREYGVSKIVLLGVRNAWIDSKYTIPPFISEFRTSIKILQSYPWRSIYVYFYHYEKN